MAHKGPSNIAPFHRLTISSKGRPVPITIAHRAISLGNGRLDWDNLIIHVERELGCTPVARRSSPITSTPELARSAIDSVPTMTGESRAINGHDNIGDARRHRARSNRADRNLHQCILGGSLGYTEQGLRCCHRADRRIQALHCWHPWFSNAPQVSSCFSSTSWQGIHPSQLERTLPSEAVHV